MMKSYISSYKDLPISVYQFQTKLRNEMRAKSGIMRGRDFICNECRFEHRDLNDWTIEGPREMDKDSVITANKYELPVVSPAVNVDAKFVSE